MVSRTDISLLRDNLTIQAILIMRTYAIFDNSKSIAIALAVLLIGLTGTSGYFVELFLNSVCKWYYLNLDPTPQKIYAIFYSRHGTYAQSHSISRLLHPPSQQNTLGFVFPNYSFRIMFVIYFTLCNLTFDHNISLSNSGSHSIQGCL